MKREKEGEKTSTIARVWRKRSPAALRLTFDFKRLSQVRGFFFPLFFFLCRSIYGHQRRREGESERETAHSIKSRRRPWSLLCLSDLFCLLLRCHDPSRRLLRTVCAAINPSVCKMFVKRRPLPQAFSSASR